MQLLYLYIENYKMYNKLSVNFYENNDTLPNYKLLNKMNITALVGENGVGKTALMSFLVNMFHNLQRSHSNIVSERLICRIR